ncbi:anti-sigma factor family protein [Desulfuribacillus alkaliarsenatis]|uniref:Putative zinc-finger domain-containing protein n=1 Tax=Desulfuribacillus alkaliarsenatis TaxID=766136 RepID=A0A1E5G6E1_9FIRM|nr:zf-HC2 domain-containing protein [Desulfuribacillus alkaliarsenatis]OEF98733.1 hypothetical protein BHF68_03480 [Desulfuribacillus alkaliarsenatis]
MNCQQVQSMLLDFIDCQLNVSDEQLVKEHISVCEECKAKYLDWKQTLTHIKDTKALVYSEPNCASIKNDVMRRIEVFEGQKRVFKRNINVWNRLASIAAVFAIMFIGYAGYNQSITPEQPSTMLAIEQQMNTDESQEKKGDVVRIASNDDTTIATNTSLKTVAPYSLGGIFLGIGAASIVMRRKLEKQLQDILK